MSRREQRRRGRTRGPAGLPRAAVDAGTPLAGRDRRRRLLWLLGGLALATTAFLLTRGWRERLLEDSARYRAVIQSAERARDAARARTDLLAELEREVAARPGDPEARLQLAQLRWRTQGPAAAVPVLEAAGRPWSDPRLVRMLAHCYRLLRREDRALGTLSEGIARFPEEGNLRADRGLLYVLLAWHRDAEREIRAAERLGAPDLDLARATLARARSDTAGAVAILERAREARPEDPELARQLAAVEESAGRYARAAALLAGVGEAERTPAHHVSLAGVYLKLGDKPSLTRGLSLVEGVLAAAGSGVGPSAVEVPRARFLRARILRRLAREAEAVEELEGLLRTPRPPFGTANELGDLYRRRGRAAEAADLLSRHRAAHAPRAELRQAGDALMRAPDDAEAHARMARLCLALGMHGRAIVEFERALQLRPGLPEAAGLLRQARAAAEGAPIPED